MPRPRHHQRQGRLQLRPAAAQDPEGEHLEGRAARPAGHPVGLHRSTGWLSDAGKHLRKAPYERPLRDASVGLRGGRLRCRRLPDGRGVKSGISSLAHAPFDALLTQGDIDAFNASDTIIEPTCTVASCCCWRIEGDPLFDHAEMTRLSRFRERTLSGLMNQHWVPELRDCAIRGHEKINRCGLQLEPSGTGGIGGAG